MTTDGDVRPFAGCDHCQERFQSGVRYPVVVEQAPSGVTELYSFCDDACRRAWERD